MIASENFSKFNNISSLPVTHFSVLQVVLELQTNSTTYTVNAFL